MQPAIKIASRVAKQASDTLRGALERSDLNRQDLVATETQLRSLEHALYLQCKDNLKRAYKDHFIAPMGDGDGNEHDASWHIFPLLNTENYLRALPACGIAVVQKKRNRVENVALCNPLTGEEFLASRGYGCSLNGRRIRTSECRSLEQAVVATDMPNGVKTPEASQAWAELSLEFGNQGASFRVSGSAVMDIAALAAGKVDGVVLRSPTSADIVIGQLICQESGILMGDFVGNPSTDQSRQFVAANPRLFKILLQTTRPFSERLA